VSGRRAHRRDESANDAGPENDRPNGFVQFGSKTSFQPEAVTAVQQDQPW